MWQRYKKLRKFLYNVLFIFTLRTHSRLSLLAGASAFILATGSVESIDEREHQLVGREAVVLLNLIVATIRELVHTIALEAVEHSSTQSKRVVLERSEEHTSELQSRE